VVQLCKKGDIYITMLYLFYKAKGPSIGTRRIMLPWFISIQDDYNNLEVTKGGT